MRRRAFLATAGVALTASFAGCAEPDGSLRLSLMDTDRAIADRYAGTTGDLPPELRTLVEAAIEGEAPTSEGVSPEFDSDGPLGYEGAYYEVGHEVVGSRTAMRYAIDVDFDPTDSAESAVDFDALPEADRDALSGLFPPPEDAPRNEGYDMGSAYTYPENAESVFVPEQRHDAVTYEGETYPVRVDDGREVTIQTYRYTAERVAADASDLASQLRARSLFTLSGLSEEERAVVEEAVDGSYYVDGSPTEAFESLTARFRAQTPIRSDEYGGAWLVRYEGQVYWADLQYPQSLVTERNS